MHPISNNFPRNQCTFSFGDIPPLQCPAADRRTLSQWRGSWPRPTAAAPVAPGRNTRERVNVLHPWQQSSKWRGSFENRSFSPSRCNATNGMESQALLPQTLEYWGFPELSFSYLLTRKRPPKTLRNRPRLSTDSPTSVLLASDDSRFCLRGLIESPPRPSLELHPKCSSQSRRRFTGAYHWGPSSVTRTGRPGAVSRSRSRFRPNLRPGLLPLTSGCRRR
jgi:hypothetical protein